MNEEPKIHAARNLDSLWKSKQNSNINHKSSSNELPLATKRLKHHELKKQSKITAQGDSGKDLPALPWKIISVVLGILCLLLLVTAIAVPLLAANLSSKETPLTIQQRDCYSCPTNWIWFRYSCYYFSKEKLTWRQSQGACLSQNSTLLKINREELHFFSLKSFFWIGVYYNGIDKNWLWENDSAVSSDLFDLATHPKVQVCLSYKSREAYMADDCETKQIYICKHHLI
ncbi:PREDICTED: natural killer cells antigen CD94 [Chrysochloris asiatica]|uniref:Natural killer cells antigen CD94 n=1 Tax=Chrysochloris asiatica TaxID=185453 RepID=A0A9B0U727_CHRAS|nr:PREDICTED: natural killer cells antigen CD94 [Chrysochloris asiatica]